jgi:hypothetical protein
MAANIRVGYVGDTGHRHATGGKLARFRPLNELVPFMSRCPKCGNRCLQEGYTRRTLRRLINTNSLIEANCSTCSCFWPISDLERGGIVIGLCD